MQFPQEGAAVPKRPHTRFAACWLTCMWTCYKSNWRYIVVKCFYDSTVILPTHVGEDMSLFLIIGGGFVAIISFSSTCKL